MEPHESSSERPLSTKGRWLSLSLGFLVAVSIGAVALGLLEGPTLAGGGESEVREFLGGFNGFGALFVGLAALILGWAASGRLAMHPVGERLRRHRIGIHAWMGVIALAMALVHAGGLMAMRDFRGWASGLASTLLLAGLFVTGWWRTRWVRAWGLRTWRWVHWELAVGALLLGFEHWAILERAKGG